MGVGASLAQGSDIMERQINHYGYPPPAPPSTRKSEIFNKVDYTDIDKRAAKIPKKYFYANFISLSKYLTKKCTTDLEKVRALFIWATSINVRSIESQIDELPEEGTPLDYLLKIHWKMKNPSHLFLELCRATNIPCVLISGVNKNSNYKIGGQVDPNSMTAQWNAVYFDGNWRFIDILWASTCVVGEESSDWEVFDEEGKVAEGNENKEAQIKHQVNEFYFLTDPDEVIYTHFPDNPEWQLLKKPFTLNQFESVVYIRDRFFTLDMSLGTESKRDCLQKTHKGEVSFTLNIPNENAKDLDFKYLLYRNISLKENFNEPLERFVFYEKSEKLIRYVIRFPIAGQFKYDIFGQDQKEHDTLDMCASYIIDCNDPQANVKPLPDNPEIGWGPGMEAKDAGMKPETEEAIIETTDGKVEIRFNLDNPLSVMHKLKNNDLNELLLQKNAMMRVDDKELVITMRVPKKGEYALNIYGDKKGTKEDLPNVCNYLIKCMKDNDLKPFPKIHEGIAGQSALANELGVIPKSHKCDVIKTDTGKLNIEFEAKDDDIELVCELHSHNTDKKALSECITLSKNGKNHSFDLNLPKAGEYAMNVYARRKSNPEQIHHVHSYFIESTQKESLNIPDAKEKRLPVQKIHVKGKKAEIRVPAGEKTRLAELQRKYAQGNANQGKVEVERIGNEDVYTVTLEDYGEYKLDLFEERDNGTLKPAAVFQIVSEEPEEEEEELTEEEKAQNALSDRLRENLHKAMASEDPVQLKKAIKEFEHHNVPEKNKDLTKAKELLAYLLSSQELSEAMAGRNLQQLEKAIDRAEKAHLEKKLGLQYKMAVQIRDQLRRIEKLRHEILNLDQKTIAEIKSYSKPPDAVHNVMTATFLLLGEQEKSLQDWKAVVVLIGKTGKEGLKRRIMGLKVEKLKIEISVRAKQVLDRFTLDDVRDVSAGAGTFYVWSQGMIEESISRFTQKGGDLKTVSTKPTQMKKAPKKK